MLLPNNAQQTTSLQIYIRYPSFFRVRDQVIVTSESFESLVQCSWFLPEAEAHQLGLRLGQVFLPSITRHSVLSMIYKCVFQVDPNGVPSSFPKVWLRCRVDLISDPHASLELPVLYFLVKRSRSYTIVFFFWVGDSNLPAASCQAVIRNPLVCSFFFFFDSGV